VLQRNRGAAIVCRACALDLGGSRIEARMMSCCSQMDRIPRQQICISPRRPGSASSPSEFIVFVRAALPPPASPRRLYLSGQNYYRPDDCMRAIPFACLDFLVCGPLAVVCPQQQQQQQLSRFIDRTFRARPPRKGRPRSPPPTAAGHSSAGIESLQTGRPIVRWDHLESCLCVCSRRLQQFPSL
jgi:hypothetical protein